MCMALMLPMVTLAQDVPHAMREILQGEPVTIQPHKAYFLLRIYRPAGVSNIEPVFLRVPSKAEMQAYNDARAAAFKAEEPALIAARQKALDKLRTAQAQGKTFKDTVPPVPSLENFNFVWSVRSNVESLNAKGFFEDGDPVRYYLVEVPPGEYILYGATFHGMRLLYLCFCLGSIEFEAKAGKIIDLGTFIADQAKTKSDIPELASETGFGPSSDPAIALIAGTIKPVAASDKVPSALGSSVAEPADYHAVGKFFHPGALGINRLVPVPSVLAYDRGKVIDVKSGEVMTDRH